MWIKIASGLLFPAKVLAVRSRNKVNVATSICVIMLYWILAMTREKWRLVSVTIAAKCWSKISGAGLLMAIPRAQPSLGDWALAKCWSSQRDNLYLFENLLDITFASACKLTVSTALCWQSLTQDNMRCSWENLIFAKLKLGNVVPSVVMTCA